MLQHQPQEVLPLLGAVLWFSGLAVKVFERDSSVSIGDNIFSTDDAPVQIASQVFQGRLTLTHRLAIDDPILLPCFRRDLGLESELFELCSELPTKQSS